MFTLSCANKNKSTLFQNEYQSFSNFLVYFLNIKCFIVKYDFSKEMKIPESKLEETERELNDLEAAREEALENLDKERKR